MFARSREAGRLFADQRQNLFQVQGAGQRLVDLNESLCSRSPLRQFGSLLKCPALLGGPLAHVMHAGLIEFLRRPAVKAGLLAAQPVEVDTLRT